ncbi:hypothetical protein SAMD00019534_025210 [Acytostelium subglobosum LB1]|uniref:hypothetical protein n=1 Tax=Acytostelium subglobosum LB1 TaxID=1410327 RepID=UPI000644BA7F|nr:hypothetical protein SAMD00019534_025210 [Acytostelium subglobosum LB1]GAM19346.1 hypothetical protein SAMD00019534_025210 [Acytostelium subglobosum LB1]|eukprot:XP_012757273.1 hypothetical protein SAMD00019534_025210 [Acytostelium subglobosum LB1]
MGSFDVNGRCEVIDPMSPCNTTIPPNTLIYLNSTETQQSVTEQAIFYINLLVFTDLNCSIAGLQFFCTNFYRPCSIVNTPSRQIAFPSLPCRSLCDSTYNICIKYSNKFPTSCNATSDGLESFPNNETTYVLTPSQAGQDKNVSIACNNEYKASNNSVQLCRSPLIYVDQETSRSRSKYYTVTDNCAIPCPFYIWSKSIDNSLYYIQTVLTSISFICSIFLILIYGVIQDKISIKMEVILSFAIGTMMFELSYLMTNKGNTLYCSDNRYKVTSDAICAINGFLFQFGANATIFWYTAICYDFFLSMRLKKFTYFKYVRIGLWTLAFLFAAIPLMGRVYVSSPVNRGCFLSGSGVWQYLFTYIPLWICLAMITLFLAYLIYKIHAMNQVLNDAKVLVYNAKQVFIMIWILFTFVFVTVFKFYSDSRESYYYSKIADWVNCIAQNGESRCLLGIGDYQFKMIQIASTCSVGFFGFLAFGLEPSVLYSLRKSRRFNALRALIGNSISRDRTSSSSGSSSQMKRASQRASTSTATNTTSSSTITASASPSSLESAVSDSSQVQ